MKCVPAAGAAQATLNFVANQQRTILRGQLAGAAIKLFGDGLDSTFTLNGFKHDAADIVGEFPLQVLNIVELDKIETRDDRFERIPVFLLPRRRQSTVGSAVERIFESQKTKPGRRVLFGP